MQSIRLLPLIILFVLSYTNAPVNAQAIPESAIIPTLPSPNTFDHFELRQEWDTTERKITTHSKVAAQTFVAWLDRNNVFQDGNTWRGSYAPVLVARVWLKGRKEPKYILVHWKWKDTRGKFHTLTHEDVDSLMNDIVKASRQSE